MNSGSDGSGGSNESDFRFLSLFVKALLSIYPQLSIFIKLFFWNHRLYIIIVDFF